ncbi:MAG: FimB/Mfa2 family fimbrial subunit, partial [Odoribacteraceae bacterium]|nr:FimB/Mfa2 family fimbrial subunit [Odoribacteraceae bacterium]
MNVSNLACLAMLAVTFGSCKQEQVEDAETGSLVTRIVFERTTPTRATSTAIPATTWTNIKQVQLFLYETTTGTIKFSDIFAPTASAPTITKTWSMVPEGEYHLVLVANTKSSTDAVETTITGTSAPLEWTGMNVRGFAATALSIRHKPIAAGFPSNISSALGAGHALKPFESPSEIFMAYSTNPVKIESGKKTDLSASPLSLKRDVALMRVRVRANDKSKGFDNTDVDFAHADASVLIYTLPDHIGIHKEDGGVSTTSDDKNVIVGGSGTSTFSTTDPTSGYNPTKIVDG